MAQGWFDPQFGIEIGKHTAIERCDYNNKPPSPVNPGWKPVGLDRKGDKKAQNEYLEWRQIWLTLTSIVNQVDLYHYSHT